MATLKGILSIAFNNVLCLRGFAKMSALSESSKIDLVYQRTLEKSQEDRLIEFLKVRRYAFFPEVILGLSIESLGSKDWQNEFEELKKVVDDSKWFSPKRFGDIVTMSASGKKEDGMVAGDNDYAILSINNLPVAEKEKKLVRIDGNHRLSAFESLKNSDLWDDKFDVYVPFCLVIFESDKKCREYGAIYFHNINFHQLRVPEEHILKLVTENSDLFPDDRIEEDPSLGVAYAWARAYQNKYFVTGQRVKLAFPCMEDSWYTFVLHCFDMLLNRVTYVREPISPLEGNEIKYHRVSRTIFKSSDIKDDVIKAFDEHVSEVIRHLCSYDGCMAFKTLDCELLMALVFFSFKGRNVLNRFMSWVTANNFSALGAVDDKRGGRSCVNATHDLLIDAFEMFHRQRERTIFLSMEFGGDVLENHSKVVHRVVDEINRQYVDDLPLKVCRIDNLDEGRAYEINSKIFREISMSGLLIADLTNMNPNVYHEIGLAMGRAISENKEPGDNILLILDTSVPETQQKVKFNLQTFRQIRFTQTEDLAKKLKREIMIHFGLAFANSGT